MSKKEPETLSTKQLIEEVFGPSFEDGLKVTEEEDNEYRISTIVAGEEIYTTFNLPEMIPGREKMISSWIDEVVQSHWRGVEEYKDGLR